MGDWIPEADRVTYARRGDRLWLLGTTLLFLTPSFVLFTVRLAVVGSIWLVLWIAYVLFVVKYFPRVQTKQP